MKADPRRQMPAHYPHQITLQTRFADMDVNGHLNNVAIARLFEDARVRYNRDGPLNPAASGTQSYFVIAHVAIDYLAEGNFPDPMTIGLGIARIGGSSFTAALAAFQNGSCIALCDSVMVHRLRDAGSAPLPEALREHLEAHALRG
ncbi:thioesterase family protein [Sandarakinorhabdus sp.]|uniref:acyl-CoA thioesterase n=1 Tax=Sandarakinorhabdus sp. TaxID=1916663 RepID=UPI00286DFDCA|nr:thioesterase family protein [Sandarakinorhabdus sp.]